MAAGRFDPGVWPWRGLAGLLARDARSVGRPGIVTWTAVGGIAVLLVLLGDGALQSLVLFATVALAILLLVALLRGAVYSLLVAPDRSPERTARGFCLAIRADRGDAALALVVPRARAARSADPDAGLYGTDASTADRLTASIALPAADGIHQLVPDRPRVAPLHRDAAVASVPLHTSSPHGPAFSDLHDHARRLDLRLLRIDGHWWITDLAIRATSGDDHDFDREFA